MPRNESKTISLTTLQHPGVEVYRSLTEAQLRNKLHPEQGLFIAESPKVISVALDAGYEPVSLLCEERHLTGDAAPLIARCGDIPVYTGERSLLTNLTGYTLTRGVLCAMRRPALPTVHEVCDKARRLVVIAGVVDTTNIGAIFRSAAALGIDGVLLTKDSCDPLNRRSVRVSMGSVFLIPWTWLDTAVGTDRTKEEQVRKAEGTTDTGTHIFHELQQEGFRTVAMALTDESLPLDAPQLKQEEKLAIVMGTEGDGLPHSAIAATDYVVRIPMSHGVDSLNVAAASAVAFWELAKKATTSEHTE